MADIQAAFDQASASAVCLGILNVAAGFGGAKVKKELLTCTVEVVESVVAVFADDDAADGPPEAGREGFQFDPIVVSLLRSVIQVAVKNADQITDTEELMKGFTAIFEDPFHAPQRLLRFVTSVFEPTALLVPVATMVETAMLGTAEVRDALSPDAVSALEDLVRQIRLGALTTIKTPQDMEKLVGTLVAMLSKAAEDGAAASQRIVVLVRLGHKVPPQPGVEL